MSKRIEFFLLVFMPAVAGSVIFSALFSKLQNTALAQIPEKAQEQFEPTVTAAPLQQTVKELLETAIAHPPTLAPTPSKNQSRKVSSPTPPLQVTEEQLWNALVLYRQEQNRTPLVLEESLCAYSRSRVKELEQRATALRAGESPLDAHAGFQRDADSGALFSQTGFPALAENLAYLPGYKSATQIIEWGWDSSSAHRAAQLGNEWTHACVVGTYPFYAALFAHR